MAKVTLFPRISLTPDQKLALESGRLQRALANGNEEDLRQTVAFFGSRAKLAMRNVENAIEKKAQPNTIGDFMATSADNLSEKSRALVALGRIWAGKKPAP